MIVLPPATHIDPDSADEALEDQRAELLLVAEGCKLWAAQITDGMRRNGV